jgi:hypothetical protein
VFLSAAHDVEDLLDEEEGSEEESQTCEDVLDVANWQEHLYVEAGVDVAAGEIVDEVCLVVLED